MRHSTFALALFGAVTLLASCEKSTVEKPIEPPIEIESDIEAYVTTANRTMLFQQVAINFNTKPNMAPTTVTINPDQSFQTMDGFGAAVTGSTCYNLLKMSQADRTQFLREAFDPQTGMGYSYIRISIGCSDFSLEEFSWCDSPGIENFAVHELDRRDLFPILKEILAINPTLKIMGSPWSAPRWMKVENLTQLQLHNSWTSGQLNPALYQDYATYFVRWVQTMETEGFPIESITIQNEPLNRGNSASMYMTWQEQRDFLKTALGPKMRAAGLDTKIVLYDHNYNYDGIAGQEDYPVKILADSEAAQFVYGSAWHAYGGSVTELEHVHSAFPDKAILFTEASIGSWNYTFEGDLIWSMREFGLGTLNRNGRGVIVWNLMLDDRNGPNRPGGCTTCFGAVTIQSNNYSYANLDRKSHYYVIGHLSRVIKPGAVRIATSGYQLNGIEHATFRNPDGSYAVVLLNDTQQPQKLTFAIGATSFSYDFPAKGITSLRWSNPK